MTETVKHTPGDWYGTGNGFVRVSGSDKAVASVFGDREDRHIDDRMLANERLISAAADMLEALIMVRDADDDCKRDGLPSMPPLARAKIDAAIDKAEGRS